MLSVYKTNELKMLNDTIASIFKHISEARFL
jgi:hypothetical protein